jgi:hypothetical protein
VTFSGSGGTVDVADQPLPMRAQLQRFHCRWNTGMCPVEHLGAGVCVRGRPRPQGRKVIELSYDYGTTWAIAPWDAQWSPWTASGTLSVNEHLVTVNSTGGAFTLQLPPVTNGMDGRPYTFKRLNGSTGNDVTIAAPTGSPIDGGLVPKLTTQWQTLRLVAWHTGSAGGYYTV